MLVRLGVVLSRSLLFIATLLLILGVISFIQSGAWHLVTLAEVLALYRINVSNFGLPGLQALYQVLGSIPLFVYPLIIGLVIAAASATTSANPTKEYFREILRLPITVSTLTITGFFGFIRTVISYTFIFCFSVLTLTVIWWSINHFAFSHSFPDIPDCDLRPTSVGQARFPFLFRCADASGSRLESDRRHYVLLIASQENPDPTSTGHAWLATVALRLENGNRLLTNFDVTGYGPAGNLAEARADDCLPIITWIYLRVRPIVPFALPLEQWWCLRGAIRTEGGLSINDPGGRPLPNLTNPAEVRAMLGAVSPAIMFAVRINRDQYDNILRLIEGQRREPPRYQLGLHDCTTFVREIAAQSGLYVPPRVIAAYPSESIYSLMMFNIRRGGY